MAITAEQIVDIRYDMADVSGTVWSDGEITRYWNRLPGAADDTQRHEAVMALMYRSLMSNSAKFRDYTAGETEEKMSQIHKQVKELYKLYLPALEAAQGQRRSFARASVRNIPRQGRNYPSGYVHDPERDNA